MDAGTSTFIREITLDLEAEMSWKASKIMCGESNNQKAISKVSVWITHQRDMVRTEMLDKRYEKSRVDGNHGIVCTILSSRLM